MRREPVPTRHCWVAGRRRNRQTNAGDREVRRCIAEAPANAQAFPQARPTPAELTLRFHDGLRTLASSGLR
jgi:hypothetical protein